MERMDVWWKESVGFCFKEKFYYCIIRFTSVGRLGFRNCLKFLFVKCMCVESVDWD